MRSLNFLIFFSVFFIIYAGLNYYIFVRGLQVFSIYKQYRNIYIFVFLLLSTSFITGRIIENFDLYFISSPLSVVGSYWIAFMLYSILFLLSVDILRTVDHFLPFFPSFVRVDVNRAKLFCAAICLAVTAVIIIAGHINASNPVIRTLEISVPAKKSKLKELNLVAVTDVHLGIIIRNGKVTHLVDMINSLKPDVVIFGGDLVDEDVKPILKFNLAPLFKKINSPLGVYAITGNHEYIGGIKESAPYIESLGIRLVRDEAVRIDDAFYFVGREDRQVSRMSGFARKTLAEIMKQTDGTLPVIVADHEPFALNEAKINGADLQISGHTHRGQMWPINFITGKIFELDYGYLKKGPTHYYVSSGFGTWGPPVRTGNRPEIVNIKIKFE